MRKLNQQNYQPHQISLLTSASQVQRLQMPDAEVLFYPCFFNDTNCEQMFAALEAEIAWRQDSATLFGRHHLLPRLTAWYGDPGKTYRYSGIRMEPLLWTPTLLQIKAAIETIAQVEFNSVLLNLYRHGQDSMGWHSDDEPELGLNPVIGSVSFGGCRRFLLRYKGDKSIPKVELNLTNGSLLLMQGPTQHFWQHHVPKTKRPVDPRINLTFRIIQ
ncbi:alpha-ketoglutarate-dependent dioxygenase AlkB [Acaryochloris sp. IP29b_bin.137]|uniref:alpha-ketoglutarate-dependent dioxygenase AlkB family protein n=1 Tax=Acaryochloris sp. IP29b_bin.137 TaxID=2969217 RepID=UPI00261207C9|nr:alpha-ketoglutarate-dependent dioxygenase AlkB [Acaryochloris sp. IP29b_bin.137]